MAPAGALEDSILEKGQGSQAPFSLEKSIILDVLGGSNGFLRALEGPKHLCESLCESLCENLCESLSESLCESLRESSKSLRESLKEGV